MSTGDKVFIVGVFVCILGMLVVTAIQKESLITENEFLKAENHMLKNALDNLGAEIEELSTVVDALKQEQNRGKEWNNNIEGF